VKNKILIVEDDKSILDGLRDLLVSEQYEVETAVDGEQGFALYKSFAPDLILLDVMMPGVSGYDLCRQIRSIDNKVMIIMLTAKSQEVDKVVGLELGADDYIVKPFGVSELLARVRANLRRLSTPAVTENSSDSGAFEVAGWKIDSHTMTMSCPDSSFELSAKELELLKLFFEHKDKVLDRDFILNRVWGMDYYGTTRTLDQYIVKLRKKFEECPETKNIIRTVHGIGYRFCC
jgi:DNA-binding response OmpR family regulator